MIIYIRRLYEGLKYARFQEPINSFPVQVLIHSREAEVRLAFEQPLNYPTSVLGKSASRKLSRELMKHMTVDVLYPVVVPWQ